LYIPLKHVKNVKTGKPPLEETGVIQEAALDYKSGNLALQKVLSHAIGRFVDLYVTGEQAIQGYITSIVQDYVIFNTLLNQKVYISLNHVKWLAPYRTDAPPFSRGVAQPSSNPAVVSQSFESLLQSLEGHLVELDLGDSTNKLGWLQKVDNQVAELLTASGEKMYWNLSHLKTVYSPYSTL
jgi:hypothetical protein